MELYVSAREEWRKWLTENHSSCGEVWLVYFKKPSGKKRIPYEEAVEEALCFGWIDGRIKKINEEYYIQRFTPRRSGSRWSKYNIARVERLIRNGLMTDPGMKAYEELLKNPSLGYDNASEGEPAIPGDLMAGLEKNPNAHKNFMNFSLSSRRMFILWLNSAKRTETRQRRIEKIVSLAERNIKPAMGVI
jgi:uncharacterized protein YdeI (YjbR/CyaY-like superfamily)